MGGSGATALLSSSADSHLPAALRPTFLGSRPPVWQGYGSLISKGSPYGGELFFHDYRNEAAVRAAVGADECSSRSVSLPLVARTVEV